MAQSTAADPQQNVTPAGDVSTIHTAHIEVYTSPAESQAPPDTKRKLHARLSIDAAATGWTDTHIFVAAGTSLSFTASGTITLADHTLTPDGMLRGWRDMLRHFPVDTANAGALVGHIGDSEAAVPFVVGTQASVKVAQSGDLFLRVNSSTELPATGTVDVDLHLAPLPVTPAARESSPALPAGNTATATSAATWLELPQATLDALPRRVSDRDGRPGDAINFAIVGTEQQVRAAFTRAGWVEVDPDTGTAILHGLLSTLQHEPYVAVPMSTLYLFGRPQDLSFARASAIRVATERHHLRCWQTTVTSNGVPLWVGAATHDIGLERDSRKGDITHRIAPAIDDERDYLRDTFLGSGAADTAAYLTPSAPLRSAQTATGGNFTTDGRTLLLHLR